MRINFLIFSPHFHSTGVFGIARAHVYDYIVQDRIHHGTIARIDFDFWTILLDKGFGVWYTFSMDKELTKRVLKAYHEAGKEVPKRVMRLLRCKYNRAALEVLRKCPYFVGRDSAHEEYRVKVRHRERELRARWRLAQWRRKEEE